MGSSVVDHRFGAGAPFTIGVEEEYMLLDPVTLDLVQRADSMLEVGARGAAAAHLSPELFQSLLEVHTSPCATVGELEQELRSLRATVTELARSLDLRLGSAGTHPFSLFERQRLTQRDRYHALVDQLQYVARRELTFGLHVHVAVDDPDKAIHVMNSLGPHLAELIALTASSPFWRGLPTGLRSSRHSVFAALPRSGPPPQFRSYDDYAAVVGQLEATGCIADYKHLWWDVRPHPRFGTVEVRVTDAVPRVVDAVAVAAYVQALVKLYADGYRAAVAAPPAHPVLIAENEWLAARHGLDASLIDFRTGSRIRVPASRLVRRTLGELAPVARELGAEGALEGIRRILADGNGAEEQLQRYRETRDVVEIARGIADLTEAPAMMPA